MSCPADVPGVLAALWRLTGGKREGDKEERFGRFGGFFSVGDLFILNFLTIVTEFIGVSLAARYFGVSQFIGVPLAAILLVALAITGNFRRWERALFVLMTANLLIFPLAILSHPHV